MSIISGGEGYREDNFAPILPRGEVTSDFQGVGFPPIFQGGGPLDFTEGGVPPVFQWDVPNSKPLGMRLNG